MRSLFMRKNTRPTRIDRVHDLVVPKSITISREMQSIGSVISRWVGIEWILDAVEVNIRDSVFCGRCHESHSKRISTPRPDESKRPRKEWRFANFPGSQKHDVIRKS